MAPSGEPPPPTAAVPAYAGRGTPMVSVAIHQHMMECSDFAACDVTVHGGASLPLTITN